MMTDDLTMTDTPVATDPGDLKLSSSRDTARAGDPPSNPKIIVIYEDPDLPSHVVGEHHTD
jgi:hypothetical protein